ncbi:MAG: hypothetical protein SFW09_04275 [Hyphomicrobiaceae bacterium]|nr:hypothetical protein [Hyphomicrobiaceae bacterium]
MPNGYKTSRTSVATLSLALSAALAAVGPSTAAAQANCEWYAKMAVRQQQINEAKKCGFTGDAWHKDLAAHAKWCQGVPPDLWKSEAQKRDQQLAGCVPK